MSFFYVHYLLSFSLSDWWTENSPFHFCSHSSGTVILDTPPLPSVDLPLLLVLPSLFTALLFDRNYMTPLPWQQRCVSENEHRGEATDSALAFNLRFVSKSCSDITRCCCLCRFAAILKDEHLWPSSGCYSNKPDSLVDEPQVRLWMVGVVDCCLDFSTDGNELYCQVSRYAIHFTIIFKVKTY